MKQGGIQNGIFLSLFFPPMYLLFYGAFNFPTQDPMV